MPKIDDRSELMRRPRTGTFAKHGLLRRLLIVAAACFVGGCKMIDTQLVQVGSGPVCQTAIGAYFLPKSHLQIVISQAPDLPIKFTLSDAVPSADRHQIYCLDYLGSGFAEDTVNVIRNDKGLLTKISSIAEDKTKTIALQVLEIGLIAATGNPEVTGLGLRDADFGKQNNERILAAYDFDPFDLPKLAEINSVLTLVYGYCLTVDGHTVPNPHTQVYCADPKRYETTRSKSAPAPAAATMADLTEANRGILYRPNQAYQLFVFRRPPKSGTRWQLYQTKQVEMPNIAPIFSIGVDRSLFVKRSTTLEFDNGVLRDIFIEKPSEALEFVEIPLRVVQALVKVPAEILRVRIAAVDNQKRLIEAQKELILNQRAALEAAKSLRNDAATSAEAQANRRAVALLEGLRGARQGSAQIKPLCDLFCLQHSISPAQCKEPCNRAQDACVGNVSMKECVESQFRSEGLGQ
jgi:hypothetical protein